jgi:hypothetical protein
VPPLVLGTIVIFLFCLGRRGEGFHGLEAPLPPFLDLLFEVVCHVALEALLALLHHGLLVVAPQLVLDLLLPTHLVLPYLHSITSGESLPCVLSRVGSGCRPQ